MCKNHVFGSKNFFLRPNGIFPFLQNEQKKKVLLSRQLALNYWPLSVAATKGPLILETHGAGRPASPRGIWLQLPLLLCTETETHKTTAGRTLITGIKGKLVWRTDRPAYL